MNKSKKIKKQKRVIKKLEQENILLQEKQVTKNEEKILTIIRNKKQLAELFICAIAMVLAFSFAIIFHNAYQAKYNEEIEQEPTSSYDETELFKIHADNDLLESKIYRLEKAMVKLIERKIEEEKVIPEDTIKITSNRLRLITEDNCVYTGEIFDKEISNIKSTCDKEKIIGIFSPTGLKTLSSFSKNEEEYIEKNVYVFTQNGEDIKSKPAKIIDFLDNFEPIKETIEYICLEGYDLTENGRCQKVINYK